MYLIFEFASKKIVNDLYGFGREFPRVPLYVCIPHFCIILHVFGILILSNFAHQLKAYWFIWVILASMVTCSIVLHELNEFAPISLISLSLILYGIKIIPFCGSEIKAQLTLSPTIKVLFTKQYLTFRYSMQSLIKENARRNAHTDDSCAHRLNQRTFTHKLNFKNEFTKNELCIILKILSWNHYLLDVCFKELNCCCTKLLVCCLDCACLCLLLFLLLVVVFCGCCLPLFFKVSDDLAVLPAH